MKGKMNIRGAAPQIALLTFLYLLISFVISFLVKPVFQIRTEGSLLVIIGIALIVPGVIMVAVSGKMILKSFHEGKLLKGGLYRIFRNPMYAAYFLFIIPGICLLFNSWLVLTTIPVNYILFQIFIQREYIYLKEKFGEEYETYLKSILIKFL